MEIPKPVLCALSAALVCSGAGCGSDEPPAPLKRDLIEPQVTAVTNTPPAKPANGAPQVRRVEFQPENPVSGDKLRAIVSASDPDDDKLWYHYEWTVDGEPAGNGERDLMLTGVRKGQSVEIRVTAHDGQNESRVLRASVDVGNRPPEIPELGIQPGPELSSGTPIVIHANGVDADGDPIDYRYAWTLNDRPLSNEGPLLDTSRMRRGDVVRVAVVPNDGETDGAEVRSPAIVIANSPPRIVSVPPTRLDNGTFRYALQVEDPDGDSLFEFSLEDAPDGMRIEPATGAIRWTPGPDQAGAFTVVALAQDRYQGIGRHEFEVQVSKSSTPPASAAP